MNAQLTEYYEKLRSQTDKIIAELAEVDIKILQKKPAENRWSVIQILNHLILAEQLSLNYLKKKYPAIEDLEEVGLKQKLAMQTMKLAQRSSKKFKAPEPVSQPENQNDITEVKTKWQQVQTELKIFLDGYPDKYLKKGLYKHPFIGRISIAQMMEVHLYHIKRHKAQIDRLLQNFQS